MTDNTKNVKIDLALATKVNNLVSKGLSSGLGNRTPGKMCVEAVVAYAIGDEENHDSPRCVIPWLIELKIGINDDGRWTTNKMRGLGMRRIAIAQLGSAYMKSCNEPEFWKSVNRILEIEILEGVVNGVTAAKSFDDLDAYLYTLHDYTHLSYSDYDGVSEMFSFLHRCSPQEAIARTCEVFVQALTEMKVPGTMFHHLAPIPKFRNFSQKKNQRQSASN